LIEKAQDNVLLLQQMVQLLQHLDDATYQCDVTTMMMSSVGAHVRHNLDHYQRFFVGLDGGTVDYDARERQKVFEIDRRAAMALTESICERLAELTDSQCAAQLRVCCTRDEGPQQATSSCANSSFSQVTQHTTTRSSPCYVGCKMLQLRTILASRPRRCVIGRRQAKRRAAVGRNDLVVELARQAPGQRADHPDTDQQD